MGIDEDAIAFRKWQPSVEGRLAALEAKAPTASVTAPPADLGPVEAAISELRATVAALEAKVNDTSGVLAGVEAALGAHSHPPSPPTDPAPATPSAPSGA